MAILSSPSPIRRAPDSHERNPISASKTPHCAKCDQRTLFANEVMRCCTCVELLTKYSSRTSSKRRGPAVDRLSQQMHGNGWASGRMRPAMPVLWRVLLSSEKKPQSTGMAGRIRPDAQPFPCICCDRRSTAGPLRLDEVLEEYFVKSSTHVQHLITSRSEERRVGKEC